MKHMWTNRIKHSLR